LKNWLESHEFIGIWQNLANPLLRRIVPSQICSSLMSLGPKRIRKKKKKASQISPESGQILLDSGEISLESLFMVRWNHC
jgi:hypothetical protein